MEFKIEDLLSKNEVFFIYSLFYCDSKSMSQGYIEIYCNIKKEKVIKDKKTLPTVTFKNHFIKTFIFKPQGIFIVCLHGWQCRNCKFYASRACNVYVSLSQP